MAFKVWQDSKESVPTVYLHSFVGDGEEVWKACHKLKCPPFNLVSLHDIDLDSALTPWKAEGIRKGQKPFGGRAMEHLRFVQETVMPDVEKQLAFPSLYNLLAGYSLAGLFALWTACQTDSFKGIACVSGSLWYPGFVDYLLRENRTPHVERIYFSLGDKESRTRHPLMSQVEAKTQEVLDYVRSQGVASYFEWNQGNHFTEPDMRMAKAIRWLLGRFHI